jgi:hypothetical protein
MLGLLVSNDEIVGKLEDLSFERKNNGIYDYAEGNFSIMPLDDKDYDIEEIDILKVSVTTKFLGIEDNYNTVNKLIKNVEIFDQDDEKLESLDDIQESYPYTFKSDRIYKQIQEN